MASGGYAWWYLDALSDDGRHGLVVIAFLGSVFSPYYALARRRGAADPLAHCAINVSLYEAGCKYWTMTERGRGALQRSASTLQIGPSSLCWEGDALCIDLDERTVPWPARVRGRLRLHPLALHPQVHALDAEGQHRWWPVAPRARVEVALSSPALRWSGHGYLDSNRGDAPLEQGFEHWHWSRALLPDGDAAVLYDARRRDGSTASLALRFGARGAVEPFDPPPPAAPPRSAWRLARQTRCDSGAAVQVVRELEDGPFYARSLVHSRWAGAPVLAIHESLDLRRFDSRWVQALLPFRMPRRGG